ncbi:MAG: DUF1624 domain-containing protein [Ignavibacterium sp.]|nr:DUF1624 domain-containing protein [Ignavibacterium sp.]MDW8374093.1 heparan-alpha-glucosaminide N-acetyltransferase domain-containing protein [Ignavibacteriales bacterium]
MSKVEKKQRIIFIDLLRAFAVIQMVQGHTVEVLLANEFRTFDSLAYTIWHFMRGMTAPIFMFTSGTVFTYLFRLVNEPFEKNPRVIKGLKRFLLLITIGYLLRFPTFNPFNIEFITEEQLNIFYSVDVLHLIGFGLLFIMIFAFISEKTKLGDTLTFFIAAMIFIVPTPYFDKMNWLLYFPKPIANYFYQGSGSLFPLFPWAGYMLLGAIMGSKLAKTPNIFRNSNFSLSTIAIGLVLMISSFIYDYFIYSNFKIHFDSYNYETIVFRVGFVLILTGLVSFISQSIESIPHIIILVGRNTLLIYVAHLLILYGSAISPGIIVLWGHKLGPLSTVSIAIFMIILMVLLVILLSKLKIRNKQLVT